MPDMMLRGGKEGAATVEELYVEELYGARRSHRPGQSAARHRGAGEGGRDSKREGGRGRGRCRHGAASLAELQAPGQPRSGWGVPGSNPIRCRRVAPPCSRAAPIAAGPRVEKKREGVREGRFSGRWAEGVKGGGVGGGGDYYNPGGGCVGV